jgi:hypothetical protein
MYTPTSCDLNCSLLSWFLLSVVLGGSRSGVTMRFLLLSNYECLPSRAGGLPFLSSFRHEADFVGPRHLRGKTDSLRFYSMNVVDLSTGRCGTQPLFGRSGNALYKALWAIWGRLGVARHLQANNEMAFYGSPTHPRGMGPLIRLCLHYGIKLWFIPQSEPWRMV